MFLDLLCSFGQKFILIIQQCQDKSVFFIQGPFKKHFVFILVLEI